MVAPTSGCCVVLVWASLTKKLMSSRALSPLSYIWCRSQNSSQPLCFKQFQWSRNKHKIRPRSSEPFAWVKNVPPTSEHGPAVNLPFRIELTTDQMFILSAQKIIFKLMHLDKSWLASACNISLSIKKYNHPTTHSCALFLSVIKFQSQFVVCLSHCRNTFSC